MIALRQRLPVVSLRVGVPVLLVLAWWFVSRDSSSIYWPPLSRIWESFADSFLFERLGSDVLPSLVRMAAGLLLALVLAVPTGLVLSQSTTLWLLAQPWVEFIRAIPGPALIPFGILFVGVGDGMKVALIAIGCFFPLLMSTMDGARGTDPLLVDTVRTLHLRRRDRVTKVLVPAALPHVFGGLRTSLAIALIMLVISEMVASTNGVGFFILQSQRDFRIADMWAGTILIGILGLLLNGLLLLSERYLLAWYRGSKGIA